MGLLLEGTTPPQLLAPPTGLEAPGLQPRGHHGILHQLPISCDLYKGDAVVILPSLDLGDIVLCLATLCKEQPLPLQKQALPAPCLQAGVDLSPGVAVCR